MMNTMVWLSTVVMLCSTDGGEGQHPTTHRELCHQAADRLPLHRQHHLQVAVTHMLRAHRHFEHIVCAQTVSLLNQHVCHAGPARSCRRRVGNGQEATAVSDVCCVCAAWILLWVSEAATACRSLTHRGTHHRHITGLHSSFIIIQLYLQVRIHCQSKRRTR